MLDNTINEKDTDINNMIITLEEILANCNLDQEIQDKKIGILGVAGCRKMDVSGVWWNADKKDRYYHLQQDKVLIYTGNSKGVSC